MDEKIFDLIVSDLRELKADVKLLLADKNKRLGINLASSFLFSLIFALIIAYIERH